MHILKRLMHALLKYHAAVVALLVQSALLYHTFSPASLAALEASAFWCMGYRSSQFRILLLFSCIMYLSSGNCTQSHLNNFITCYFMNLNDLEEYMMF